MTKKNIQENYTTISDNLGNHHGMTLNVNFGNIKGNPKVIFFDTTCVISSSNGIPHILIASTEFSPKKLPDSLENVLFNIPNVNLILSFNTEKKRISEKYPIPNWIKDMRRMAYLRIEDASINGLKFLLNQPIKQLILINVKIENRDSIIKDIAELKNLKYLVHSLIFTPEEVTFLKKKLPELNILLQHDYYHKVDKGEIGYEN